MPRRRRLELAGLPLHIVQRGNDRRRCFFVDRDYLAYLDALREASTHYHVGVHAYVLMTNHVHLLVTPREGGGVSRMMQSVGARYVRYVNETRHRTGTLWEGRFRSCLVEADRHVLAACRYIDLNPVRAGLVPHPANYRWSSYRALAGSRVDALVNRHEVLEQFGLSDPDAYARWCAGAVDAAESARLRESTERGVTFGSEAFRERIASATGRDMTVRPRGRPPRSLVDSRN